MRLDDIDPADVPELRRQADDDTRCEHGDRLDDCLTCWIDDDARWKRGQDR